ncbi:MAG: hypothetical protein ACYTE1_11050 [Planctomycetota bacterium]|jgi:hypothetical protein
MATHYTITKLTQQPWLNLFDVAYSTKDGSPHHWLMCSRKDKPVEDAAVPDAVVIVPIVRTPAGNRDRANACREPTGTDERVSCADR